MAKLAVVNKKLENLEQLLQSYITTPEGFEKMRLLHAGGRVILLLHTDEGWNYGLGPLGFAKWYQEDDRSGGEEASPFEFALAWLNYRPYQSEIEAYEDIMSLIASTRSIRDPLVPPLWRGILAGVSITLAVFILILLLMHTRI